MIDYQGDPIDDPRCPKCGGQIVYNGNYFCNDLGSTCDWALPDTRRWDKFAERCYQALMRYREQRQKSKP